MNRLDLIKRVRSLTRDFSNAIFREPDIIDYLNEGIDRVRQVVPEMDKLNDLQDNGAVPNILPKRYHHLLALYSASRCFGQDERHYQATNFMNEFEQKLDEMKVRIESGEIVITDPDTGTPIEAGANTNAVDFVKTNDYFENRRGYIDYDEGVEGVK